MPTSSETGTLGERAATELLRSRGYMIEALNWRSGHYEIDIIASHQGVLHIVEVKTRRKGSLTTPEAAITAHKFRSLSRAASAYLATTQWQGEVEFDLVAVEIDEAGRCQTEFVENAMEYNW